MLHRKIFSILIITLLLSILLSFSACTNVKKQSLSELQAMNDGPHVFVSEDQLEAFWVCKGEVLTAESPTVESLKWPKSTTVTASYIFEACNMPAKVYGTMSTETEILEYKGDYTVAALSDFHGQYDLMIELLKNNHIIDENKQWTFGNGHFVITGDIFDRGKKVTEILWFLYDLERQAELAGGKIHLTLGNHEVMILNGNYKYLADKYKGAAEKLNKPYNALFSKDSVLGNWLRSKPVLVKVNDMLFAHGGFHPRLAKEKVSLEAINRVFKESLVEAELATPREGLAEYLHKKDGPIWYRGYFKKRKKDQGAKLRREKDKGATLSEIDLLLEHFDVKHIIVGHTSQKHIETRFEGKVIAIDSSMKKGKYGEILFIEKDQKWRGSLSGEKLILEN